MKRLFNTFSYTLYAIFTLIICNGQQAFSQEQHELSIPPTPLMNDSVTLPQVFIKNRSLVDIVDSISRIQWQKTGKQPQDYILQLFMIRDDIIVYTSWIQIDWLVDDMYSRSNLITTNYFTRQRGKVIGFVGYNNCNFYIVDIGIPEDIRNNILEVCKNFNLTFRIHEPIKELNGMKVFNADVHRGTATYMMINGQFVRCTITRGNSKKQPH